jgi:putative ABC transport system substrate-binding protein
MRRREFIAGLGGVAASATWPTIARAQQSRKIPVLGVLWHAENAEGELGRLEALRAGLEDAGRIEGKNIKIIDTFAAEQYERFDINAAGLVAVPVDILFAHTQPAAMAAHRATDKIPIVFTWIPDPVQAGLVASLNRPGGNITGFSNVAVDLSGKKLQMMQEVTASSRLGFLANATMPISPAVQLRRSSRRLPRWISTCKSFRCKALTKSTAHSTNSPGKSAAA